MDHQQHLDLVGDLVGIQFNLFYRKQILQLGHQRPRVRRLLFFHRIERPPEHRQPAHHTDHWFSGRRNARDRTCDVIFEQLFAVRREHRQRKLLIEEGHRQTKIKLFLGIRQLALDAVEGC